MISFPYFGQKMSEKDNFPYLYIVKYTNMDTREGVIILIGVS